MSRFIIGILTFFVISNGIVSKSLAAGEPSGLDFEFGETTMAPATVVEKSNRFEIHVGKEAVYDFAINPDPDDMNKTLGFEVPDKLKEKILAEGGTLPTLANPLESFQAMDAQEQIKFRRARMAILQGLARLLHYAQPGMTLGMITKDSLSYVIKKGLGKAVPKKDKTFAQRRYESIQGILNSVNNRLFYQAPLVANRNEVGFVVTAGGIGLTGLRDKGFGGVVEAGLSIGFNTTSKSLIFELSLSTEKFNNSIALASIIGTNFKAGPYMGVVEKGSENKNVKGLSFYPPMIPGYSASGKTYMGFGASTGLGFPPPPIADFLTFSNDFERVKVLRVSVSPFVPGFVRLGVGELGSLVVTAKNTFVGTYELILNAFNKIRGPRTCPQVFAI